MMGNYPKYSKYKDSGFGWLGRIPDSWETIRTKFLFSERVEKGHPNKSLLAATQTRGVIRKENYGTRTVTAQKDFHLLKLVKVGDFVISLRSFQGGIEISYEEGIISPAYTIMIPSEKVEKNYIKHLFKSRFFILSLNRFVTGIREGQNIDYKKFKNSFLPIPPINEQFEVAKFLDDKIHQVDHYIQLKEKTIALLQEQKAAIINQVVTKGLDPNVPMKDSGIEWLGEIPAHWEVIKLRYLVNKMEQGWSPLCDERKCKEEDDIGVIKVGIVNDINFKKDEHKLLPKYLKPKLEYLLKPGDFLISRANTSELIALAAIVPDLDFKLLLCDKVYRLNLNHQKISKIFLLYAIRSSFARKQIETKCSGASASMQNISQKSLKEVLILCPNSITEQNYIGKEIKSISNKIENKIKNIKKQITLIKEYKESLIAATVTGKINVSNYQQRENKTQKALVE